MSATAFTFLAGKPFIDKDPNAELDYTFKLAKWLDAMADTISVATPPAVAASEGITVLSCLAVGKTVVIWVAGGTVGSPASATVRVTTTGGRKDDWTLNFKIKQK